MPQRYQTHITKEINRILRDQDKAGDAVRTGGSIWRRESEGIRAELDEARAELEVARSRLVELEARCEESEKRANAADVHYQDTVRSLREVETPSRTTSPVQPEEAHEALVSRILEAYADDTPIELFVNDCATATHRGQDKAREWIKKLQNQDIMTVGDLSALQDEDWAGIGLTVFALRALKNMLKHNSSHLHGSSSPPPQLQQQQQPPPTPQQQS